MTLRDFADEFYSGTDFKIELMLDVFDENGALISSGYHAQAPAFCEDLEVYSSEGGIIEEGGEMIGKYKLVLDFSIAAVAYSYDDYMKDYSDLARDLIEFVIEQEIGGSVQDFLQKGYLDYIMMDSFLSIYGRFDTAKECLEGIVETCAIYTAKEWAENTLEDSESIFDFMHDVNFELDYIEITKRGNIAKLWVV